MVVAAVIVWAARNDRQERQDLLSGIFRMSRPTSRASAARDRRTGGRRPPPGQRA